MFEAIQKKMKEGCKRFKAAWPELKEEWVDVWRRLVVLAIKIGRLSIKALCLSGKMIGVFFQNESVSNAEEKKEVAVMETMNNLPEINVRKSACEQEIKDVLKAKIKDVLKAIRKGCPEDFERIKKRVRRIDVDLPPGQWPHDGVKRSSYDRGTQTIQLHAEVPAEHVQGVLAHWLGRSILHRRKGKIATKDQGNGFIKPRPNIYFPKRNAPEFDQLRIDDPVEYRIVASVNKGERSVEAKEIRKICASDLAEEDPDQHRKTAWKDGVEQAGHLIPSRYEDDILADYYGSKWGFGDDVCKSRSEDLLAPREPADEWWEPHGGSSKGYLRRDGSRIFQHFYMYCFRVIDDGIRCVEYLSQADAPDEVLRCYKENVEHFWPRLLDWQDEKKREEHHRDHVQCDKACFQELCGKDEVTEADYTARAVRAIDSAIWTCCSHPQGYDLPDSTLNRIFIDNDFVWTFVDLSGNIICSCHHRAHGYDKKAPERDFHKYKNAWVWGLVDGEWTHKFYEQGFKQYAKWRGLKNFGYESGSLRELR